MFAACAKALGVEWDATNDLALDAVYEIIDAGKHYLDAVSVIGVDEHRWSHNRKNTVNRP